MPAATPLLLGPADRETHALRARRARALGATARARVANTWLRLGGCAVSTLVASTIVDWRGATAWLAGFALVVLTDRSIHQRLGARCEAGDPPQAMPGLICWTAFQSAYGNAFAALLWFAPHPSSQALAAIFLCGSLANAAATLRASASLSIAGVASTTAFLLGLPVIDFFVGGARDWLDLLPFVGGLLLLFCGVGLWRGLAASDVAQALAEAAALRERQSTAAAAAAKADMIKLMNVELRTPLAALLGAAEQLRRSATTPGARAQVAAMVRAGDVLKLVLSDLSEPGRIENGEVVISPEPSDPRDLARAVVSAFRASAHDKHLELFLDVAPDVPAQVDLDPLRVRQILFNLLANAVGYTIHGGVRVRLDLQTGARQGHVRLAFVVSDTGPGLSRSQLALLFGRDHVRAEGEAPDQGLAISVKLARLMGGRLQARSELGQGSAFTFVIDAPVAAAQAPRRMA